MTKDQAKELFFQEAAKIGFKDRKKVIEILREMGYRQSYQEEDKQKCLALLLEWQAARLEEHRQERIKSMMNYSKDSTISLPMCPIHNIQTIHVPKWDKMYGLEYGWSCPTGGISCMIRTQWAPLKKTLVNPEKREEDDEFMKRITDGTDIYRSK
jgi:hypothetical protein